MGSDPYSSLDPGISGPTPTPAFPEVSATRALLRGSRKLCPRCGERDTFMSWFQTRMACPRCDLRFAREEGGFLGAMTINYAVSIGSWLVVLVAGIVLTVPDMPVVALLVLSAVVLIGVPLWFYPRSKMIWTAVEFLIRRSEPDYRPPTARSARQRDLE
jgi:uncharacterized protein (DUF983 family)